VAAAERRRGRRDNGLDAADWRPVDDLDPRISEEVLDLLAAQGIAAYVQPAVDVDPITRSATLPSRPSDRLYVDRRRAQAARESLRQFLEPGPSTEASRSVEASPSTEASRSAEASRGSIGDFDATFAGIVAGFDHPVDATTVTWPAAEGLPTLPTNSLDSAAAESRTDRPSNEPPPQPGPIDARHVTEPSLLDALAAWDARPAPDPTTGDQDELPEQFVPPPPPPLPRLSRQTVLGTLAILAGLVMVVGQPDLVPLDRTSTILLGFATIVGGAVALILRLRPGTEPEDTTHPNDGAQV
jgi:hypothetical protein